MDVNSIIKQYRHASKWEDTWKQIDQLITTSRTDKLIELASALESNADGGWCDFEAMFDYIERALALSNSGVALSALVKVLRISRVNTVRRPTRQATRQRRVAEMLGCAQTTGALCRMLVEQAENNSVGEMFACWVQERIVRGHSLRAEEIVSTFWSKLAVAQHPLAILPLELLDCEAGYSKLVPRFLLDSSSGCGTHVDRARRTPPLHGFRQIDLPATAIPIRDDVTSAVRGWEDESNGRIESKAFQLDQQLAPEFNPADLLHGLPLESLDDARPSQLTAYVADFAEILDTLFAAATNGGAYGGAAGGAYGRLRAWQSVQAFMDAYPSTNIPDSADRATRYTWILFHSTSTWFNNAAGWDFGITAVSPNRDIVRVLAATDTD